ncbi:hypothetical protein HN51_059356 [Arachis hypogaea]
MSISPNLSPRQCPDRYSFRAGRNLPDKEFRYLRTKFLDFPSCLKSKRPRPLASTLFAPRTASCLLRLPLGALLRLRGGFREVLGDCRIFKDRNFIS